VHGVGMRGFSDEKNSERRRATPTAVMKEGRPRVGPASLIRALRTEYYIWVFVYACTRDNLKRDDPKHMMGKEWATLVKPTKMSIGGNPFWLRRDARKRETLMSLKSWGIAQLFYSNNQTVWPHLKLQSPTESPATESAVPHTCAVTSYLVGTDEKPVNDVLGNRIT
jgi:hypothetical protein